MSALWALAKFFAFVSLLGGAFVAWAMWFYGPLKDDSDEEGSK